MFSWSTGGREAVDIGQKKKITVCQHHFLSETSPLLTDSWTFRNPSTHPVCHSFLGIYLGCKGAPRTQPKHPNNPNNPTLPSPGPSPLGVELDWLPQPTRLPDAGAAVCGIVASTPQSPRNEGWLYSPDLKFEVHRPVSDRGCSFRHSKSLILGPKKKKELLVL